MRKSETAAFVAALRQLKRSNEKRLADYAYGRQVLKNGRDMTAAAIAVARAEQIQIDRLLKQASRTRSTRLRHTVIEMDGEV